MSPKTNRRMPAIAAAVQFRSNDARRVAKARTVGVTSRITIDQRSALMLGGGT
jgi:hypothetical protein